MNQRHLLSGLVALGVCANVWYWWPTEPAAKAAKRPAIESGSPEALRVKLIVEPEKVPALQRDLFQPKVAVVKAPPPPPKAEPPPGPPPKTPEQLAEEAARAELAQIKLVGIVFRGQRGEAFVVRGDQAYVVRHGERIGDRFTVESISTDSVVLKDAATQVSGKVSVSGK